MESKEITKCLRCSLPVNIKEIYHEKHKMGYKLYKCTSKEMELHDYFKRPVYKCGWWNDDFTLGKCIFCGSHNTTHILKYPDIKESYNEYTCADCHKTWTTYDLKIPGIREINDLFGDANKYLDEWDDV